eukprot:366226-Chlamydomonas_euryale.AAC.9
MRQSSHRAGVPAAAPAMPLHALHQHRPPASACAQGRPAGTKSLRARQGNWHRRAWHQRTKTAGRYVSRCAV